MNINNILFQLEKLNKYILIFIPLTLITGPFLSDLSLCIISLFFIIISIQKKTYEYYRNFFVYLFIFFYIYLFARSFFVENIFLSLHSSLFYIRYLFFILGIAYIINIDSKTIKYFTLILFFSIIIVTLDAYLQFFTGSNILGFKIHQSGRLSGFFNDEYIMGSYLVRLLPIYFALLFYNNKLFPYQYLISIILLIAVDVLIYLSGERTAFLLLCLASILFILFINQYRIIRLITLILSSAFIILLTFNNDKIFDRIITTTINQSGVLDNEQYIITRKHNTLYKTAINMFIDNPFFGQGPNQFREQCKDIRFKIKKEEMRTTNISCSTHPHNNYLQLMAETGIVGFLVLIFLLFYLFYLLIKDKFFYYKINYLNNAQIGLIIVCIVNIWPFAPTGNFFNNYMNVIYFLPVGLLVGLSIKNMK